MKTELLLPHHIEAELLRFIEDYPVDPYLIPTLDPIFKIGICYFRFPHPYRIIYCHDYAERQAIEQKIESIGYFQKIEPIAGFDVLYELAD